MSTAPITVHSSTHWFYHGEMVRHLPVRAWGREHRTFHAYLDRYGTTEKGYDYTTAQAVIIAAYDSTVVDIETKVPLEDGGPDVKEIGPLRYRVRLDAQRRVLLRWKVQEEQLRKWTSDPTGTLFSSTKPVSIIAGHSKVGVMRLPDEYPTNYRPEFIVAMQGRNGVFEAALPQELAGTEFVTIPLKYYNPRYSSGSKGPIDMDSDTGDVIRFVALSSNTILRRWDSTQWRYAIVDTLQAGEVYTDTASITNHRWSASKPVHCMQYGKSFVRFNAGTPSYFADPFMQAVPPIDRWVQRIVFTSIESSYNYCSIVFRGEDHSKIYVDGSPLTTKGDKALVWCTDPTYRYVVVELAPGDHAVVTTEPGVRFMAWPYGTQEGVMGGPSHGSLGAVELTLPCEDSIVIQHESDCLNWETTARTTSTSGACAQMFDAVALSSANMAMTLMHGPTGDSVGFRVVVLDSLKDATLTARITSRSGRYVDVEYRYVAPSFSIDLADINFGAVLLGTQSCDTITIFNRNTSQPLRITGIRAQYRPGAYSFAPNTAVIPPNGSIKVRVCATVDELGETIDTVVLDIGCMQLLASELRVRGEEPTVFVTDTTWENACAGEAVAKSFEIINGGKVDIIILDIGPLKDSAGHFEAQFKTEKLPIVLRSDERIVVDVVFRPLMLKTFDLEHRIHVNTNAKRVDTIAVLRAFCDATSVADENTGQISIAPQPYQRSSGLPLLIESERTIEQVCLYDLDGRKLFSSTVPSIDPAAFTGPGLYLVHVITSTGPVTLPVVYLE